MPKAESGRTQLLSLLEAADFLGVHRSTIHYHRQRGTLTGVPLKNGSRGFHFRREDLEALKKKGGLLRAHTQDQKNTAVALHLAQDTANKVDQLLRMLGLDHAELGIGDAEIIANYNLMLRVLKRQAVLTEMEELHLVRQFAGATEGYMRKAVAVLKVEKPWRVYLAFFSQMALGYTAGSLMRAQITNASIGVRQAAYLASGGKPVSKEDQTFLARVRETFTLDQQSRLRGRAANQSKPARAKA